MRGHKNKKVSLHTNDQKPRIKKNPTPVLTLWTRFPDFGPDPDSSGQIGTNLVRILHKFPYFL